MGKGKKEEQGLARREQTEMITESNNTYDKFRQRKTRLGMM